ncbi:hypothetical protein BH11ACT6_BH11ACT6_40640 [soil metagenome]
MTSLTCPSRRSSTKTEALARPTIASNTSFEVVIAHGRHRNSNVHRESQKRIKFLDDLQLGAWTAGHFMWLSNHSMASSGCSPK